MASCDEGYDCAVCGKHVEDMRESSLYLRYIVGEISLSALAAAQEAHLACNPFVAQFIDDEAFPVVVYEGPFSKSELPREEVDRMTDLYTGGWRRLLEVFGSGLPIQDYPLVVPKDRGRSKST